MIGRQTGKPTIETRGARLFQGACKKLGIEPIPGVPNHPKCQGNVERWWRTWAELLKPVRDGKLYRMPIAETQVIVNQLTKISSTSMLG